MTTGTIYGIASCDSCRKARRWLDEHAPGWTWVDLRRDGVDAATIGRWLDAVGAERLVNRRSTTWRELEPDDRPALDAADLAEKLAAHPTLIKRPVFDRSDGVRVGFDDAVRQWITGA